jgi:hypothetical protein
MTQHLERWRPIIATLVLTTQLGTVIVPSAAYAQAARPPATGSATSKRATVQSGVDLYEQARFDEAITTLRGLVDRAQLPAAEMLQAREYLARSLVKKGMTTQGKDAFTALLRANPAWRPDPIRVPPDEIAVFEQALKELPADRAAAPASPAPAPKPSAPATPPPADLTASSSNLQPEGKKSGKTLWYVLGGAAVVGLVAVLAGGGGSKDKKADEPLSGFPATP